MTRWSRLVPYLQVAPLTVVLLVFLGVPLAVVVAVSFFDYDDFTVSPAFLGRNYLELFGSGLTHRLYLNTLQYAAVVWALTLVIGSAVADMVVVMTQGHIEQAGTAQEIYSQPQSAYVVRFMGGHNVLSGHVAAVANGSARLVSDDGERYVVPMQPTATAGETVLWFAVRRDRIELGKASQDLGSTAAKPNAVYGTVQAIEYQGSYVKVTIHRAGHEDVIAHVPDRSFFPMQVHLGDPVVAQWAVEDVHTLRAVGGRPYDQALTASLSCT